MGEPTALEALCTRLGIQPGIQPGQDADSPGPGDPGDTRYALGAELGSGGQGRVLVGFDRNLRRSVAIKVLGADRPKDARSVQAFLEEAIITGGLSHPNIVPAYELGYSEPFGVYYTMKRLSGRTLDDVLRGLAGHDPAYGERYTLFRLLSVFVEICRAVAYAHARGVIHTDLKPSNVLLGDFGEVWVVDWGLAQVLGPGGAGQVRANMRAGTPYFMSPEQIAGEATALDGRTDVWALGVILYQILTLEMPFEGADANEVFQRVMTAPFTPPSERAPGRPVPPAIEQVCLRALRRNPASRYPSVQALLHDAGAFLDGTREQMKRTEQAGEAVRRAEGVLARAAPHEAEMDAVLDRPGRASEDAAHHARRLLPAYEAAGLEIARGLEHASGLDELQQIAGDLYWRVFMRVYPWLLPAEHGKKQRAAELLQTLSSRALPGVVRAGRGLVPRTTPLAGDGWLPVLLDLVERKDTGRARAFSSAMGGLAARVAALKNVSLFAEMSAPDLLPIAEACVEVHRHAGQTYFAEGDRGDALYVILEGRVRVLVGGDAVNTMGPSDTFGEIAILDDSARTATVESATESRCLALDAARFRKIVRSSGEIGWALIEVVSRRLRGATARERTLRGSVPPPPGGTA